MITLKIAAHQIVTISFPCSDNVLQEKLKEAGLGEMIPASAMVVDVLEPKDLPLKLDFFHNLDEINYLAKRMDSFTPRELDTFIEAVKHEEYDTPKDMINTTFNLQAYSLFQDLSSMENVGKQYLLSKQGCITQDELENIDFVTLGKQVLNTGNITVSDHGLLCKIDGAIITEIYDGTIFPPYDYTGNSLITVELSYKEKTEYLYLPDDDLSISKAIARLGADSLDDCYCYISDISTDVGDTKAMLNRLLISEDLFAVNTVSSYINLAGIDLKKLQALIEYANVTDSTSICVLADRMDYFTFIEDITTDEEVGKYFVDNDEDYSVSAELEDYIKYDELGEHLREEMEGMFNEHGYVSMNNACETVHITLNDGEVIENKIIRGNIIGKKVDEDGFEICGALFGLFSADETDFTEDSAILTCESNEIGVFYFTNVPYGKYIVREIKAAPAFVLNETCYEVNIKEDGDIIEIGVENKLLTGTVKTIKVDKDYPENTLAGAVFEIYVDVNGNKEFDTDIDILVGEMSEGENGIYTMGNLRYNGYFLHEKTAPEGFLKDNGYYYFEIRENGVVINIENQAGIGFTNQAIKGNVEVIKVDAELTDTKLFGAVFKIYEDTNKNGEYDTGDKFITKLKDTDGIYRAEDIRYGNYFLTEETAPVGFVVDTTVYCFEIRNHGETIVISNTEDGLFTNKAITGELEITKTDLADGKPLENVGFRIKDKDGNVVAEEYTDKNGVVKFTLRYGKYTYTEFAALEGYTEDTEEYPFEITKDGQVIKVKMTNEKIPTPDEPESPKTGDASKSFWLGLGAVSLGGLISLAFIYFKQKNTDTDDEE